MKVFSRRVGRTQGRTAAIKELLGKGAEVTYEEVLENVRTRDHIDETRSEGPLRCAADAVRLDNSAMTIEEQNAWLLDLYRERTAQSDR